VEKEGTKRLIFAKATGGRTGAKRTLLYNWFGIAKTIFLRYLKSGKKAKK